MIAASPDRFDSLQLIQLTLSLLRKPEADIPEDLRQAFMAILEQAKILVEDPRSIVGMGTEILPEAITLALLMRRGPELAHSIEAITEFEHIEPHVARDVLGHIESHVAA